MPTVGSCCPQWGSVGVNFVISRLLLHREHLLHPHVGTPGSPTTGSELQSRKWSCNAMGEPANLALDARPNSTTTRLAHSQSPSNHLQSVPIQWVPFVLVLQAISYLLPELFWMTFSYFSGFPVSSLLGKAHKNILNKKSKDKSEWVEGRKSGNSTKHHPISRGLARHERNRPDGQADPPRAEGQEGLRHIVGC